MGLIVPGSVARRALLAAVGVAAAAAAVAPSASAEEPTPPLPNIVVIMTDDQPAHTMTPEVMPNLHELLLSRGTSFSDYIATTPLCCPSRATLLTGQYGHNNGVLHNDYAFLREKRNVLPQWLRQAGYRTAHIGKFLHRYEDFVSDAARPAPGWDFWFDQLAPRRYYDWTASRNGKRINFGSRNRDHATAVSTRIATRFIGRRAPRPGPFYLQLSYFAPHGGAGRDDTCKSAPVPMARDVGRFARTPLPRPPSFNEADVSDKPWWVQALPRLTAADTRKVAQRYRCTLESLAGVDRGIRRIRNVLRNERQLSRTIFIFTSDNGWFFGEHRIKSGKNGIYEENLRMPLVTRVPPAYLGGARAPAVAEEPVANIDLAPTILDFAAGSPCRTEEQCRTLDGRSLLPLLAGQEFPAKRSLLVEVRACNYRGLRESGQMYIEHLRHNPEDVCEVGDTEHYDLTADPYQLDNLFPAEPESEQASFQLGAPEEIKRLRRCAGLAGRDPLPDSGEFCE